MASGQITHMGYLAQILLWDISGIGAGGQPTLRHSLKLHKVQIQALAFSCEGTYLASVGGPDDNNLVIWKTADGARPALLRRAAPRSAAPRAPASAPADACAGARARRHGGVRQPRVARLGAHRRVVQPHRDDALQRRPQEPEGMGL